MGITWGLPNSQKLLKWHASRFFVLYLAFMLYTLLYYFFSFQLPALIFARSSPLTGLCSYRLWWFWLYLLLWQLVLGVILNFRFNQCFFMILALIWKSVILFCLNLNLSTLYELYRCLCPLWVLFKRSIAVCRECLSLNSSYSCSRCHLMSCFCWQRYLIAQLFKSYPLLMQNNCCFQFKSNFSKRFNSYF